MKFSANERNSIPEHSGVYIFKDSTGKILYVGKAINLKKRVATYFLKKKRENIKSVKLRYLIFSIEIIPVPSEFEALLLEAKLIKKFLPKFNVIWKDDKHYLYLKITREEFPQILLSRSSNSENGLFYGPFPSARTLKEILRTVRRIYPYCTQNRRVKKKCFYTHIGLCDPCPGEIIKYPDKEYKLLKRKYLINIRHIKLIFEGKSAIIKSFLVRQMLKYSKLQEYEMAAKIKEKIKNLSYLISDYKNVDIYIENPEYLVNERKNELKNLVKLLNKYGLDIKKIDTIECYDISNISGKHAVGSMVRFLNGSSDKNLYRRFKIQSIDTPDDYLMLQEVISRRLKHKEWSFPDLFLIDGGIPQLTAIREIFKKNNFSTPVLGITKKNEELVVPIADNFKIISLRDYPKVMNLITRIRDEAHRFAHDYHVKLRSRRFINMFETKQ